MISEIKFPEIPKIPLSRDFQSYLETPKAPSKFDKILSKISEFVLSETIQSSSFLSRLMKSVFSIKKNLIPKNAPKAVLDTAKEAQAIAESILDAFSIITGVGAASSLIRNLKKKPVKKEEQQIRKWETFRSFLQIITGVTSFLNLLDRFKLIQLATITKAMGTIPVIGQALAQAFPASVVFSLFTLTTSQVTIIISALKLEQIASRIQRINAKSKTWNHPITGDFAQWKMERIVTKQKDVVQKAHALKTKIAQNESTLQTKGQNYEEKKQILQKLKTELGTANKISRFVRTFQQKNALKTAKMEYKKEVKKYKVASTEIKTLEKSHKIRLEKGKKWETILGKFKSGTLTAADSAALEKMRAEKAAKWKSKKAVELFAVAKEATRIALTLISIAIAVSLIALTIFYTGNIPAAALITIAVAGLSLAAVNLTRSFYFKRIKKKAADSVTVPDFRTLKIGV